MVTFGIVVRGAPNNQLERRCRSFGDLIWLSQSGRSPPAARGQEATFCVKHGRPSQFGQYRSLPPITGLPDSGHCRVLQLWLVANAATTRTST